MLCNDVPLRTRRALSLYKVCGDNALLVLNGTSLYNANALLALSRQYYVMLLIQGRACVNIRLSMVESPPMFG